MINNIDPILINFFIFSIRWYAIFLVLAIILIIFYLKNIFEENKIDNNIFYDFLLYLTIAGILGARIGYIIFYNLKFYLQNPLEIIMVNHGGLSSHGLTIGILIGFFIFIKKYKLAWKKLADLTVLAIPILIIFVRIGNFFNSEIVGRVTNLPWGVKFLLFETPALPRHPVQLYEAILGLFLLVILYIFYKKKYTKSHPLLLTNIFLLGFFGARFFLEFFNEYQIFDRGLTMGQYLSLPIIIFSLIALLKITMKKASD